MREEMESYNLKFVKEHQYEKYLTGKYPQKKLAIITCMDTRLTELLPAALGLKNGDAKIIRNAGGTVLEPFGETVRSLLIAIFELHVDTVLVIGHTDCGVQGMNSERITGHMIDRGIPRESITLLQNEGISLESWLKGFDELNCSVKESVNLLRRHPLIPEDVSIYGYVMDTVTGKITPID